MEISMALGMMHLLGAHVRTGAPFRGSLSQAAPSTAARVPLFPYALEQMHLNHAYARSWES